MKIKSVRIQNFRSFQDQTVNLNRSSCFVGPNGAGKSSILSALNVFFREQSGSPTDVTKLTDEDYYGKNTTIPVRVTVTFDDLNATAQAELAAYVRQSELVVTAEATFDVATSVGTVRHFGQRSGMEEFRRFFEGDKAGMKASELTPIFDALRQQFPDLPNPRSKDDKADALRTYEAANPDRCTLIPSEDNFYGVNSTGKLSAFVQWVYVPAVKDACEEGQEAKNTALGKLIARAVRTRTNFDAELETLKNNTLTSYRELLERNQGSLNDISLSLQRRLESWAHPNVKLGMQWLSDPSKSVVLQQPVACIKTGEGDFIGSLARMGHGLQRSYLLALLQELAGSEAPDAPTLILGCEEPELYQHPPQARHLADVFGKLATGNNQILVTTHSPLFVSGNGFENTRLVRRPNPNAGSTVRALTFQNLCTRIRTALGEDPGRRIEGLVAKIHQALQPAVAEMFFARVPVLVEGLEDVSYITTELHLLNQWSEFRRLGCHLIPVSGKDKLIQPLAIAIELGIPVFVVFDADGDTERPDHRIKHERDNRALLSMLGGAQPPFPATNVIGGNHAIWTTNLTDVVKSDFGANYQRVCEVVRVNYAHEGGLEKNDLFIADWLATAREQGVASGILTQLCQSILDHARTA
ncbi:MAG: AAA family ATPase [Verrucomicrobiales bacterium]|nr:AAA family ATPase [Verrucomicrobiales bacterium]